MQAMAKNGQRWAHIFDDSYSLLSLLLQDVRVWEELFDETLVHIVEDMGHTDAPAADFRYCLEWIESETPPEELWTFEMGNAFGEGPGDAPVHTVQVSPFLMQNTEVTVDQLVEALNWGLRRGIVTVRLGDYGTSAGERWYYQFSYGEQRRN